MNEFQHIIEKFDIEGSVKNITPYGNGLINDTYYIESIGATNTNYLLQRINHNVFQDVDLLQKNIETVTSHIRKKLEQNKEADIDRKVLKFVLTRESKTYFFDGKNYWRMMIHINRSLSHETVNPEYSYIAGLAFGNFQYMLVDLTVQLGETIPKFHNMEFRLQQFKEAVKADKVKRVAQVKEYIEELEKRADDMCLAERLYREGKLEKRMCHCDTKVNNLLFDENGQMLCVIDLDTVMSSFIFSDYGDFLRTAANTSVEDEKDLEKVNFNMSIFESFTKGYLQSTKSFLTTVEIDHLPYAAALFAYMQCVRFFTDYINGDTYYKTQYPGHNLVRTKAQLKLLQSIESYTPQMKAFIKGLV